MKDALVVAASAPVRVDFAGGWTDVAAYAEAAGGAVVNVTLARRVHVEAAIGGRDTIFLRSEDLDLHATHRSAAELTYDGTLDLHKAALNMLPVPGGVELITRTDIPAGSGLGASGALDVALLAALARLREESYDAEELAEMGYLLECGELGLAGGRQDQYAAALGGCLMLGFSDRGVAIRRPGLSRALLDDLSRCLVVVYTGQTHFSHATHTRVWEAWASGAPQVVEALEQIRAAADDAATALGAGDFEGLAAAMDRNWAAQQRLDATIATPRMQAIEAVLRAAGAWGVKACGAGAGGCLAALAPPERAAAVREAAAGAGGVPLDSALSTGGVEVAVEEEGAGRAHA